MITARHVAEELGVAVSTVGRAMADDPRISAETKAKVRRVADRLGYVGNNPARIMRGGSSNLIGLMIPDVANDFYASIAQAMSDCVDRQGYRLVLSLTRDDREIEARHIRELIGARSAGIILVPTANPKRESRTMLASIPNVQFLRNFPGLGNTWFGIDDKAAIRTATAHLIGLGHKRIAYLGGREALSTGASRVAGYRAALSDAGLSADADLERLGEPTATFGEQTCLALLDSATRPTALLTGSVHITEGVIQTIEKRGIDIPRQLSVVGFGGSPWFSWWRGGLTTICPPVHELATSCGLWFLNNLNVKAGKPSTPHASTTNSTFIQRCSTGAPGC